MSGARSDDSDIDRSENPATDAGTSATGRHTASPNTDEASKRFALSQKATAGVSFGHYRLMKEIGRGGQGAVWLATDDRLGRRVALKLLSSLFTSSRTALDRFHREAELTSRLVHPGICPVYETGEVDGCPFIAMAHIEGETLAARIDRRRPLGDRSMAISLSTSVKDGASESPTRSGDDAKTGGNATVERSSAPSSRDVDSILALFESAAKALHAAHEAGIVHRDIKPGNIMITRDDQPVILDFGLAAADDDDATLLTRTGEVFGTPSYMSPEQIAGESAAIDRRSDIWALGVTLYETLTNELPFRSATRAGLNRAISEQSFTDPRRLNPAIPRDVVVILGTALEKSRDHRFRTALDFAEDLSRARRRLPILSRPPGLFVRMVRWIQRYPELSAVLALLFMTIFGALLWTMRLLDETSSALEREKVARTLERDAKIDAEKARDEAQSAQDDAETARAEALSSRDEAEAASNFLTYALTQANPEFMRYDVPLSKVLELAIGIVNENSFASSPKLIARVAQAVGSSYAGLGFLDRARTQLVRARELREEEYGLDGIPTLETRRWLALVDFYDSRYDDAQRELVSVLQVVDARLAATEQRHVIDARDLAELKNTRLVCLELLSKNSLSLGLNADAEAYAARLMEGRRETGGEESVLYSQALQVQAFTIMETRGAREALPSLQDALARLEAHYGREHYRWVRVAADMGYCLAKVNRAAEGVAFVDAAETNLRKISSVENPCLADILWRSGYCRSRAGDREGAEHYYETALEVRRRVLDPPHRDIATSLESLGSALQDRGDFSRSRALHEEALAMRRQLFDESSPAIASSLSHLGSVDLSERLYAAAIEKYRMATESFERSFGPLFLETLRNRDRLAYALQQNGDLEGAEREFRACLDAHRTRESTGSELASALNNLGSTLLRRKKFEEGVPLLEEALVIRRESGPQSALLESLGNVSVAADMEGKADLARERMEEWVATARRSGAAHVGALESALATWGRFELAKGRAGTAAEAARELVSLRRSRLPAGDPRLAAAEALLGRTLVGTAEEADGEKLLLDAYESLKGGRTPGPALRDVLRWLCEFYEAKGDADRAEDWRERLAELESP